MGLWKQTRELGPRTCDKQQSATKLVEILCPKGNFWRFTDFKRGKNAFPPPSSPYNVVPLFELPIENNKHPRGQGRGVDCLAYLNTISPRFCRQFEFLRRWKGVLTLKKTKVFMEYCVIIQAKYFYILLPLLPFTFHVLFFTCIPFLNAF